MSVPFNPNPFLRLNGHFDQTPRYLFRLYAPNSAGQSNADHVSSPAANTQDIFTLDPGDAAVRLYRHLSWSCDGECNLMSWTTSLLFALQYGLYRSQKDGWSFNEIFILVVDTRDFPPRTFVKDLDLVKSVTPSKPGFWNDFLALRKRDYFGEYLSQGTLGIAGRCVEVSMWTLIDRDLFEFYPPLGVTEGWDEWANAVMRFRGAFTGGDIASSDEEVQTAITIARGFGERFALPVAAMLLAFRPRRRDDPAVLQGFRAFSEDEIRSLHDIRIDYDRVPELRQFEQLVNDIHRAFTGKDINWIEKSFRSAR